MPSGSWAMDDPAREHRAQPRLPHRRGLLRSVVRQDGASAPRAGAGRRAIADARWQRRRVELTPLGAFPTRTWRPNRVVADALNLRVAADPPGDWRRLRWATVAGPSSAGRLSRAC